MEDAGLAAVALAENEVLQRRALALLQALEHLQQRITLLSWPCITTSTCMQQVTLLTWLVHHQSV